MYKRQLLTFGLLIKTLQFVQAATVAVATVKTWLATVVGTCLLYTSDAADDLLCVDLGGRRIIKKKNT